MSNLKVKDLLVGISLEKEDLYEDIRIHSKIVEAVKNPYFLEKDIEVCTNSYENTATYQIKGTNQGIHVEFEPIDPNYKRSGELEKIEYIGNVARTRGLFPNPDFSYVQRLKEKYNLPEDFIKKCGDIEPFYKKLTESKIKLAPYEEKILREKPNIQFLTEILGEDMKEVLISGLCDLNEWGETDKAVDIAQKILEFSKTPNKEATTEWNIGKSDAMDFDTLYTVKHIRKEEYKDEPVSEDILFTTFDKNLAEEFIKKYSHEADCFEPYYDYNGGCTIKIPQIQGILKLDSITLVKSMDMTRITPEFFGGINPPESEVKGKTSPLKSFLTKQENTKTNEINSEKAENSYCQPDIDDDLSY
jgi:hypothetical protein